MKTIRTWLMEGNGEIVSGGEEGINAWKQSADSKIWIDVQTHEIDAMETLLHSLGCPPLAIKDSFIERHPPKVDFSDDLIFVLYRGIEMESELLNIEHQQISFFIGDRFLVSLHPNPAIGIESFLDGKYASRWMNAPFLLACQIMHASSGVYLNQLLAFEITLSELEDTLQEQGNDVMMAQLVSYKSRLLKLKRIFNYHLGIARQLVHEIANEDTFDLSLYEHEINRLYDRFERLNSLSQMQYEICGDLIEGYISISSHQLNVTMRVLTVISSVFIPLTFLAGIYGMNFAYMPELGVRSAYFILLSVMVAMALGLLALFKRKGWI